MALNDRIIIIKLFSKVMIISSYNDRYLITLMRARLVVNKLSTKYEMSQWCLRPTQ